MNRHRRRPQRVLALLVFGIAGHLGARPILPADLFQLQDIAEVRISPDGGSVVFLVIRRDPVANRTMAHFMKISTSGGAAADMSGLPENARELRWSPDGKRIAFLAGQAVWALDVASGKAARICAYDHGNSFLSKSGNSLAWSPDGMQLAFAGAGEPAPPAADPAVVSRMQFKTRTAFSDNRRTHIYVVPAAGGKPRALTSGNFDEHSIAWCSREIVFLSNREPDPDANLNYDLFAVDASSGAVRRITQTPGVEMDPVVSPDGHWIAYTATKRPLTTIDSVAEDAHIWAVPLAGGDPRELNASLDRRSTSPRWSGDGRSIVFTAADHGKVGLYQVSVSGGEIVVLAEDREQVGPFDTARDGSVVFSSSNPVTPSELYLLRHGRVTRLTSLNSQAIRDWDLVQPETFTFRSFDGTEVEGFLYAPPGKSPLVLSIHGGPHGMLGYAFTGAFQLNASHGYATLAINPRGSSGYGQRFADGCVNDWGGGDYRDLMAGLDYVLDRHPALDRTRLAVRGGSYGGYMTNWVITQTPRFKAAVSLAGLSNLISFYGTSLYQDLMHAEFGGFPWAGGHYELLWQRSPLRAVERVTTPTLFLHGEQDNDVPITQAEEMYVALRRRGVESMLVRYPREGHGFHEPKHQLDSTLREFEWLDRFLK